ncbi:DUF4142 domain-containing protein [Pseudomonas sp. DTU_2021_1001937_2_SI_NGA_ILE_001]|uniref:DUF4142 domain-containing protein n=1 Tax=Pseudomonas sp. DTU_2021_1001937_2_SI_NGA_ILE_001 TaxID=3077589 RepID=UPI0028FC245A|nr:DUF4142 domain-containing protein [Pseudomonas sp. DTU_2021_1001937_2_SI_NGA_ILE_001]WNW12418.1 DUF4142 domain-containing protein [Pseudomonas sp. DTU_2021_1001937_2_SI_NGA_ILE_001]
MRKVFRAGALSLMVAMASATAFAADPEDFVDEASAKGIAEIEAGKMALQKSQSADVKTFAQMMIDDHTAANAKLKAIAEQKKLKVSDDAQLMDKAKAMILDIREESFDRSYANNQVKAHEQTIELFEEEAKDSKDAELKAFAEATLPKLKAHLAKAKELAAKHGGDAAKQ